MLSPVITRSTSPARCNCHPVMYANACELGDLYSALAPHLNLRSTVNLLEVDQSL